MKYQKIHLKFARDSENILVSIADLLDSGIPIDEETGEDLNLVDDDVYDYNGEKIVDKD